MILEDLNSKWLTIKDCKTISGYKAIRLSASCVPDLFIGEDINGFRCLILFLPNDIDIKLKGAQKKNISIEYNKKTTAIVIQLSDANFSELFNDLIMSLHNRIQDIKEPDVHSRELICAFYKWVELFEPNNNKRLSPEQIKGLFGELFILRNLLYETSIENVDEALQAWQGPYDTSNDFIFDSKNTEVKTKMESLSSIWISSEFQLEKEFDKELELAVVSVKMDLVNGESIYDILVKITQIVRENIGDLSILYHTLSQLGLTVESTMEYNNNRFLVSKVNTYDCGKKGFPGLSKSNIPTEISNLKYNLRITTLQEFMIQEKHY